MPELPISPALIAILLIMLIVQPTLLWFLAHSSAAKLQNPQQRILLSSGIASFLLLWLFLALSLGIGDFFNARELAVLPYPIPNMALVALPLTLVILLFALLSPLRKLIQAIPMHWLILLQVGRVIGFVFLILAGQGLLPYEFATSAGWGDFITGISAPLVAWLWYRQAKGAKTLVLLWNIFGFGDLVLAVVLGLLTTPSPLQRLALDFQFHELVKMGTYPLVLIPTFVVPLAQALHIFGFYKLWHQSSQSSNS